jgi:DNA-directed RNA polymerase specialized sigma24 family protein
LVRARPRGSDAGILTGILAGMLAGMLATDRKNEARMRAVRDFVHEHRALLVKHARHYVQANAEKIPLEDVAREIELECAQLASDRGVSYDQVAGADAFFRSIVKHAAGRAKRRRKLIEQIAAGDDLEAFSEDLKALDRDLPTPVLAADEMSKRARATLDTIKKRLPARDALVFALLVEDDSTLEEVARTLSLALSDVNAALGRALVIAEELGVDVPSTPSLPPPPPSGTAT